METLQKELELLQRQKAASEQAAISAKQRQGSSGVWGWLAGSPGPKADDAWKVGGIHIGITRFGHFFMKIWKYIFVFFF